MAQIQPVQIWKNGQNKEANNFGLRIIADDLSSSATFYYCLSEEGSTGTPEELSSFLNVLSDGNLSMSSEEYDEWDNSNEAAYAWAATKLGLVIIP
jgi:hypothetical protein